MSKTYNLFISHSWSYSNEYEKLEFLLKNRQYFYFKNFSVPKDNPVHTKGTDKIFCKLFSLYYGIVSLDFVIYIFKKYNKIKKIILNSINNFWNLQPPENLLNNDPIYQNITTIYTILCLNSLKKQVK